MISNLQVIWIMSSSVLFCNIIKVNHFLYHFIILLHLISSFSLTGSLVVPYAYVSLESTDSMLLLSFELNAILLTSSVKTLRLSLLNLSCVFDIDLLFFYEFFMTFFKTICFNFIFFQTFFILKFSCFKTVFIIVTFKVF